jgi:hypothetical protein
MVDTYEKARAVELLEELVRDGIAEQVKQPEAKHCVRARDGKTFVATSVGVLRIR